MSIDCPHIRHEVRRKHDRAGRPFYVTQCLDCGDHGPTGAKAIKPLEYGADPRTTAAFDEDAYDARQQQKSDHYRQEALAAFRQECVEKDRQREADRRERAPYYMTPQWRALRAKVFLRSARKCEGCAENPATEVHHLTYDNFGGEFLWELVAICHECHERVHAEQDAARAEYRAWRERQILGEEEDEIGEAV